LVEQRRGEVLRSGDREPTEQRYRSATCGRLDGLQRRDEVVQKAHGIAVVLVERQPGDPGSMIDVGEPAADERRLAEPGLRGDQRQGTAEPVAQPLEQPGARYQMRARRRSADLRLEQR